MNNDRFKFRVWDNENKMYDDNGFLLNGRNGILVAIGDFAIEQCTGLRDRNGKLIYEGDICAYSGLFQFIVEWRDGGFADFILPKMFNPADCEVVGNIHEVKHE